MSINIRKLDPILLRIPSDKMGYAIKKTLDYTKDEDALTAIAEWVVDHDLLDGLGEKISDLLADKVPPPENGTDT